jgi:outer membrane protein TolC
MNLKRKYLLFFILLTFFSRGFSQDNKEILKLSVADAKTYALEKNRSVQSAKLDVRIADKKVWETIAIGLPQFGVTGAYQHQFQVPEVSFGSYFDVNSLPDAGYLTKADVQSAYKPSPLIPLGVPNNATFDLTLSQLIFNGEYLVGLQATKVLKMVSELSLEKTEDMTKENVATTYYLALVLDENAKVLKRSLTYTDKTYNDMVKMNQQGFNEDTDVDQLKIGRSNIQTLITSLEAQKEISLKLLKYQLGMDFAQQILLTDSLPVIIGQGNMFYLSSPEFNVKNNVDYRLVSNQEKISSLQLKREQSKYLPAISSFYRHQEQLNAPAFNFAVKDLLGVSLNLPIVTSGQRSAKISQAKFDLEKSRLNKDNAEQGLIMEYETAKTAYETAYSNFIINKESMELSKKVYDKTAIKYAEGVSTSFELSQNIDQFLTAQSKYYNSVQVLLVAKARLDRILGVN